MLEISANHHGCQHLPTDNHKATNYGRLLAIEPVEDDSWQDAEEGASVQHEIEPCENFIFNLVLFFDVVEISTPLK